MFGKFANLIAAGRTSIAASFRVELLHKILFGDDEVIPELDQRGKCIGVTRETTP